MSETILEDIPPLQLTSQRIMMLVTDQDVDLPILAGAIEEDPVITGRLLSIANSAYYAPSTPVSTVSKAIIEVLGVRMVKALVLGMIITDVFETTRCRGFSPPTYWTRALATAQCAHRLAPLASVNPEEAYLAGLLHNVGLLYFAHVQPEQTSQVLHTYEETRKHTSLCEIEQSILGTDHCEIGEALTKHWQLPKFTSHVLGHYIEDNYRNDDWQINLLVGFATRCIHYLDHHNGDIPNMDLITDQFDITEEEVRDNLKTFPGNYESIKRIAEFLAPK